MIKTLSSSQKKVEDLLRELSVNEESALKELNSSLLQLQNLDLPREERRRINKMFVRSLVAVQGSKPAALVWMKRILEPGITDMVLTDFYYQGTLLQKTKDKYEDIIDALKAIATSLQEMMALWKAGCKIDACMAGLKARCGLASTQSTINWSSIAKRMVQVILSYMDLCKDTVLCTFLGVIGDNLISRFTDFPSQITLFLVISVVVPLMATGQPALTLGGGANPAQCSA